jgi:two-component system alkaline phosphatase synthesis response regulator PhoP
MVKILILTTDSGLHKEIRQRLLSHGFTLVLKANNIDLAAEIAEHKCDALLVDIDGPQSLSSDSSLREDIRELKREKRIPVILLVQSSLVSLVNSSPEIDDFVVKPLNHDELLTRIKRSLKLGITSRGEEIIKCGDLVIDQAQCEVFVAGRPAELTFKEYELLRFLAMHKNRVFSREALLDQIWGIDYFGGDRTVDVHIRRLRGKIEDAEHTFIDTVRNVGYKFKLGK